MIPTAVSLISVGIGVWIARWSFTATSKRDHKRWILEQKKIEWRELLDALTDCWEHMISASAPPYDPSEQELTNATNRKYRVTQLIHNRLFIQNSALNELFSRWNSANSNAERAERGDLKVKKELVLQYRTLITDMTEIARKDLGLTKLI